MNKWIILIATLFIAIVFSTTIQTTRINPTGSNLIVSSVLGLLMFAGLYMFNKSCKYKTQEKEENEFTPID